MKKILLVSVVIGLVGLGVVAVGRVSAQTLPPTPPAYPGLGPGMMGGNTGYRAGMMRANTQFGMMGNGLPFTGAGQHMGSVGEGHFGPIHIYMFNALAEALHLTPEELQDQIQAGETLLDIAHSQGIAYEQFPTWMVSVRTTALHQAVANGVITQAQADLMIQHMQNVQSAGFSPGFCHGAGFQYSLETTNP